MFQDKIRVGLVGAGQNTQKMHIPKLLKIPGIELVEVANRTLTSTKNVASKFKIQKVRSNWKEVVTSPNIDAVVIGTWPYLHSEVTCAALNSGKHVLCEARMAMNLFEAQQMAKVSRANPGLIAQLVPAPFTLHLDKTISTYIEEGHLGEILYFHVDYQSNLMTEQSSILHWRRNKIYSGENAMALGIIYESLLRWIPKAKRISAVGHVFNNQARDSETQKSIPVEIPDYLSVHMELENGIRGSMIISEIGIHGPLPNIRIFGTCGSLKIDFVPDGKLWFGTKADNTMRELKIPSRNAGFWRVEEEFVNAIRGKENVNLTTFDTGVDYMRFTQAVMDSYRQNGQTKLI